MFFLVSLGIFTIVFIDFLRLPKKGKSIKKIIKNGMEQGRVVALDVRSQQEFKNNKSIGAENISIQSLSSRFLELDHDNIIVLFCESGGRANIAKTFLRERGFNKVINIESWQNWNSIVESN